MVPTPTMMVPSTNDEVEGEDRVHEQQPEDRQTGPEQPLVEVQQRWVMPQPARLDVVEHDRAHEEDQRRDGDGVEQVREVGAG